LEHKSTSRSFDVARYYDKMKAYRAAVIYYNEVIRQQPGSAESEKAKQRIDQLRAKLGDKVLQPLQETEAEKKKAADQEKPKSAAESTPASNSAPVLPPELDGGLPPPASTSPAPSVAPQSSSEPETSPTPEPSSTPDESPVESATPTPPENSGSSEATASSTP
jgi:outer membrane protein assembly factor BamD